VQKSSLNPSTSIRHPEPEVENGDWARGMTVRTEGLLQLACVQTRSVTAAISIGKRTVLSRQTIQPKLFSRQRTISNVE